MKWVKRIAIGAVVVLLVAVLGFVGWTMINRYSVLPGTVTGIPSHAANRAWRVFAPDQPTDKGFIIYPGGLVDPDAYATLARQFAERGTFTVIVPMPLDLAVLSPNRADQVMKTFPNIKRWAIGGHSLGGAMAAQYISSHPEEIPVSVEGLVLWGARSQADVSNLPLNAVSIYGTLDGIAPAGLTDADRLKGLPADTKLVAIEGGNHSMFGDYGLQTGDNPMTIPLEDARKQIVDASMTVFN